MVMFDPRQRAPALRTRRDQIARIRTRLGAIEADGNSAVAYARLIGVLKGIMDIIEDDGE